MKGMQPCFYQFANNSCWHTAFLNALLLLLGDTSKIPLSICKILFSFADLDGTTDDQAEEIAQYIKDRKDFPISTSIITGRAITKDLILNLLGKGSVLIVDVHSGNHSLVVKGVNAGRLTVFDSNYDDIKIRGKNGCYSYIQDNPHCNVLVDLDYFFSTKGRYTMGMVRERIIIEMHLKVKS